MSDLQIIESALKTAAKRHQLQRAWRGFWTGLLAAGLIWLVVFALYKLLPIPSQSLIAAGSLAGLALLVSVIASVWRKKSLLEAARWIDEKQNLQQRLSTAWEVAAKPDS